jgi:hypothetical protein
MSVNLTLDLRVAGLAGDQGDTVAAAIGAVCQQHDIERDVVLSVVDGELRGATPYPMIISRAWKWRPLVEADIVAAVASVAPDAVASFTWGSPDEA